MTFPGLLFSVSLMNGCATAAPDGFYRGKPPDDALTLVDVRLRSISNDNAQYYLSGRSVGPDDFSSTWAWVRLNGKDIRAEAIGRDDQVAIATFRLDRGFADRAAEAFSVSRQDRIPLDEGLEGVFSIPETVRLGDPIPVTLEIRKVSGPTVGVVRGGRNRGPRNNRFSFTAAQGGVTLPTIEAYDFGGRSQVVSLDPGESLTLTVDLRQWVTPEKGPVTVVCQYAGELSTDPRQRQVWDVVFAQTVPFTVTID